MQIQMQLSRVMHHLYSLQLQRMTLYCPSLKILNYTNYGSPQNAVLYPTLAVKGSPQSIRVIRPLAADRTLVEAWSFRVAGAPDVLFERTQTYNRLVFSPMSVVAHDDVHLFESIQQGLRADGNPWVSLHRNFDRKELEGGTIETNGTSELLMRNQYRAWAKSMLHGMEAP